MPTVILVDANSVGYAGQYAADLSSGDQPTQAVYNTLQNLQSIKSKNKGAQFFYLWDGHPQFRYDLLPDYKGNRNQTEEQKKARDEYRSQRPLIQRMLKALGIPQVEHPDFEADDLGCYLTHFFLKKGYTVKLISSDKDWLQLIQPGVSWHCPRTDRFCNFENFQEVTGFDTVEKFISAKCIQGDKSDCVPGITGLGEKACEHIFARWPNVPEMVKEQRSLGGFSKENIGSQFGRYIKKMNAFCANEDKLLERFRTNMKLMNMRLAPPISDIQFVREKGDCEAFFDLCLELAFHSIIRKRGIYTNLFFPEAA